MRYKRHYLHHQNKKRIASAILEDLKQVDAIEIIEEPIHEWQKQESLKRLSELKIYPASQLSEWDFFKSLDEYEQA